MHKTENLAVRRFREDDTGDLFELLSDAETMKYLEPPFSYDKTASFLRDAGLSDSPLIHAVENKNQEFVGYIIYHPFESDSYEIGWVINRKHRRLGYASELTELLISSSKGKTDKLIIECVPQNTATVRIAEKHGFVYSGDSDGLSVYVYTYDG